MRHFSATFSLLHRRSAADGFSLTPEGRGLLLHMAWSGPLTVGELATHTDRAQSVVSESLAVLESHELVARVRDPRDRRRTLAWLTDRARHWLAEEQEPLDRTRVHAVLSAMTPEARSNLLHGYQEFVATAQRLREASLRSPSEGAAEIRTKRRKGNDHE